MQKNASKVNFDATLHPALSVCSFVCLSVSQLVHPFVLWLVLLPVLPPDMHCIGALSVRSFVCLSVGQLVNPWSFGWFSCRSFHQMDACQTCFCSSLTTSLVREYHYNWSELVKNVLFNPKNVWRMPIRTL